MNGGAVGAIVLVVFAAVLAVVFLPWMVGNVDTSNIVNDTAQQETFSDVSGFGAMVFSLLPLIILAFAGLAIVIIFLIFVR